MHISSKIHKHPANSGGFTLIELLVVIGILAILLAITLLALNPTQHFQGARNAQRSSDITAILDSIYEYEAANKGSLPPSLATLGSTATEIATGVGNVEPCSDIAPTYVADMPLDPDPNFGTRTPATSPTCSAVSYNSGYTISKSGSNRLTVSAPHAEGGAHISVTR